MTNKNEVMKNRIIKSALALTLCTGMMLGGANISMGKGNTLQVGTETVFAEEASVKTLNNLEVLKDTLKKLDPEQRTTFSNTLNTATSAGTGLLTLCKGVTASGVDSPLSLCNGTVALLKLVGVIKDDTTVKLTNIEGTLKGINSSISEMNGKLTSLESKLDHSYAFAITADRSTKANQMRSEYKNFYDVYVNKLNNDITNYKEMINEGFKSWVDNADKNAISIADGNITLNAKNVTEAMNGVKFHIDYYQDTIREKITAEVISCANSGELAADKNFYTSWNEMTGSEKNETAKGIADMCFETLAESISKEQMNSKEGRKFVNDLAFNFNAYCEQIVQADSPIDAELKLLFLTHGFEGEVRDSVNDVLEKTTLMTGAFAIMATSAVKQCDMQSNASLAKVEENWTAVTEYLETEKNNSITGYDNYCYLTDSLVTYETRDLNYKNFIDSVYDAGYLWTTCGFKETNVHTDDLLNNGDKIMGTSTMNVLYDMYKTNPDESGSFYNYLEKEGTGATEDANTTLVTEYNGWSDFNPSEGIYMNYGYGAWNSGRDYWSDQFTTTVNKDNKGDVKNENFKNCKKATATVFNPSTGESKADTIIGALAVYVESSSIWSKDEMYLMGYADTCKTDCYSSGDYDKIGKKDVHQEAEFTTTCGVMVLSPVPEKAQDDASAFANAIDSMDQCQIVTSIYDVEEAVCNVEDATVVNPNPDKEVPVEEIEDVPATENTDVPAEGAAENTEEISSTDAPAGEENVSQENASMTDSPVEEVEMVVEG